ncbi:unnamed protein product, partial [Allacma fusca]
LGYISDFRLPQDQQKDSSVLLEFFSGLEDLDLSGQQSNNCCATGS